MIHGMHGEHAILIKSNKLKCSTSMIDDAIEFASSHVECIKNCDVLMLKLIALHAAGMKIEDQVKLSTCT